MFRDVQSVQTVRAQRRHGGHQPGNQVYILFNHRQYVNCTVPALSLFAPIKKTLLASLRDSAKKYECPPLYIKWNPNKSLLNILHCTFGLKSITTLNTVGKEKEEKLKKIIWLLYNFEHVCLLSSKWLQFS